MWIGFWLAGVLAALLRVHGATSEGAGGGARAGSGAGAATTGARLPDASLDLRLEAPIRTWDEAVPLGNGRLGGLLWGEGDLLRLSLDRGDLWDERPAPGDPLSRFTYAEMVRLAREGKNGEISRIADRDSYDQKHPTKIPAGRVEIRLGGGRRVRSFELHLATAEGRALLEDGGRVEVFFSATEPVALLRLPGTAPANVELKAPESVKQLGYPAAVFGAEGGERWFVQEAASGQRYGVVTRTERAGEATLLAVTVVSSVDGGDLLIQARERLGRVLKTGYAGMFAPHAAWWAQFWSRSSVTVPDPAILRHYTLVQYFLGAASRLGAPPMPLQGVWTADAGTLPPWKGDYHHDLNTQMTYMAYQAAGRFEEGRCFLDFLEERLPVFRRFAKDFFGTPGANVPGVMTLAGAPLGGWAQYSLSPVSAGWLAHLFYLHWRFTGDADYLRNRAYPWCSEVGESLAALLTREADGRLVLPASSSPEIHDNSARAWLKPNSNYDLAILRMLFLSLREMALATGKPTEAERWAGLAAGLGGFHADPDGTLRVNADESLTESHRHFSNLMNLYPFNLTTIEGTDRDREMIRASLKLYDRLGTRAWCGYSFSWMAAMRARVVDADEAARNLELFVKAFILRNGFHANGDQTKSGLSDFTYRPFTLEGNFLAAAALQEMLIQSWSTRPGGIEAGAIRVFPAVPARWREAAFEDLVAEGGHRVSARRENGATTWLKVIAGPSLDGQGEVRIRDNFGARTPRWNRETVRKSGEDYLVVLKPGEAVEGTFPNP
jgi:alpha-L-fucosidase 2